MPLQASVCKWPVGPGDRPAFSAAPALVPRVLEAGARGPGALPGPPHQSAMGPRGEEVQASEPLNSGPFELMHGNLVSASPPGLSPSGIRR